MTTDDLMTQASETCSLALAELNTCITKLIKGINEKIEDGNGGLVDPPYDQPAVVHLAWLTQQVIVIMAEIGKLPRPRAETPNDLQAMFR